MDAIKKLVRSFDDYQRTHRWIGFPCAVVKKFGDDQAGNLAALIAYYAFVSVFPLLLLLVTILGIVLRDYPSVQHHVLDSALTEFPVIGPQLKANVGSIDRTGVGFAVGIIGTFLGVRGAANAAQNAFNTVWQVPVWERPGFPGAWLRSYGMIAVVGIGLIVTSTVSGIPAAFENHGAAVTWGVRVGAFLVSLLINVGVFTGALRLGTAGAVRLREMRLGILLSALIWQVLQTAGTYIVTHELKGSSSLYGVFGVVLGLIAWFYLQAELMLYAVEADVVHARGLWPRSVKAPPYTDADERAYAGHIRAAQLREDQPPGFRPA